MLFVFGKPYAQIAPISTHDMDLEWKSLTDFKDFIQTEKSHSTPSETFVIALQNATRQFIHFHPYIAYFERQKLMIESAETIRMDAKRHSKQGSFSSVFSSLFKVLSGDFSVFNEMLDSFTETDTEKCMRNVHGQLSVHHPESVCTPTGIMHYERIRKLSREYREKCLGETTDDPIYQMMSVFLIIHACQFHQHENTRRLISHTLQEAYTVHKNETQVLTAAHATCQSHLENSVKNATMLKKDKDNLQENKQALQLSWQTCQHNITSFKEQLTNSKEKTQALRQENELLRHHAVKLKEEKKENERLVLHLAKEKDALDVKIGEYEMRFNQSWTERLKAVTSSTLTLTHAQNDMFYAWLENAFVFFASMACLYVTFIILRFVFGLIFHVRIFNRTCNKYSKPIKETRLRKGYKEEYEDSGDEEYKEYDQENDQQDEQEDINREYDLHYNPHYKASNDRIIKSITMTKPDKNIKLCRKCGNNPTRTPRALYCDTCHDAFS